RRKKRGLEPDECFWIQNEPKMRGKREYDPEKDQHPDLVLEVDISRSSLNRLVIYAAFGVPEVWRWDGKHLEVRLLDPKGQYVTAERGLVFPFLRPSELVRFVDLEPTLGEADMIRAFQDWVRAQVASGWPNLSAAPSS